MRTIKFRAWDNEVNEMILPDQEFLGIDFGEYNPENDCEIMQYIGLDDSEGKEIYEGDIVEYLSRNPKFLVEFNFGEWRIQGDGIYKYKEGLRIIGNKFENPELLRLCTIVNYYNKDTGSKISDVTF